MKTKLLRLIIEKLFCKHKWSVEFTLSRTYHQDDTTRKKDFLVCSVCGKIKKLEF